MIFASVNSFDWSNSDPRRVYHGRGRPDSASNFANIDRLGPVILITLYREYEAQALADLANQLITTHADHISSVLLQRRYRKAVDFELLAGQPVTALQVCEAGLNFCLHFDSGMHTGLFLDMAQARRWVHGHAANKRVLNLFAYTCAFSVAALAGGADAVINIDMSSSALTKGRENHRLNNLDMRRVSFFAHDIFRSWGKLKRQGPYDMVVVDPPSHQPGSFVVSKDYGRLVKRLVTMLAPNADLLFCLNDPARDTRFMQDVISDSCARLVFQRRLANPVEFNDSKTERALKVLYYRYQP